MRNFICIFPILLLPFLSFAQANELVFVGKLSVKDGGDYSYKLDLTDSNGVLKGCSITDINGSDETKTAVTGNIDPDKKHLFFRETHLIQTKSKAEELCYIQGKVKIMETHGVTALKGNFTGYKKDGKTTCATGKIELISAKDLLAVMNKLKSKDSAKTPGLVQPKKEIVYEEAREVPESAVMKVKYGDNMTLECPEPEVILDIWDAKTIDGDVITLLQDGKVALQNYTLAGMHKQIPLHIGNDNSTTLTLIAVNEGSEPLNTARIKITSGNKTYYVDATTTMGKNVVFTLRLK